MSILDRTIALCEKEQETYIVPLPSDDQIEFRHVTGPDEVSRMEAAAQEVVETIKKGTAGKEILLVKVKDPATLIQAYFMKTLYVRSFRRVETETENGPSVQMVPEPDAPTFVDWLTMAKKVPFAFRTVWARVDDELTGRATLARRQAVEEAKKGSVETQTSSQNSEPAGMSGDGTPENSPDSPGIG